MNIMQISFKFVSRKNEGYVFYGILNESINSSLFLFGQNMTGGVNGGVHATDVTNASRTMLMNIHTLKWDAKLYGWLWLYLAVVVRIKNEIVIVWK